MTQLTAINSTICNDTFKKALEHFQRQERYEPSDHLRRLLAHKIQIDAEQWDTEDLIRNPSESGDRIRLLKKKIDGLNQQRTDAIELLDDWIHNLFTDVSPSSNARFATETPAWALDRLSILHLKIYHMWVAAERLDVSEEQKEDYSGRLQTLKQQHIVLSQAIDNLLSDLAAGQSISYTYKQMKMYNDPDLNPVLRNLDS